MGAYGCALIAKNGFHERGDSAATTLLNPEEALHIKTEIRKVRCGKCTNNCLLTINQFSDGKIFVSGNRCEKGDASHKTSSGRETRDRLNLFRYKYGRLFEFYKPLAARRRTEGRHRPSRAP